MFAILELTEENVKILKEIKTHNEDFEEMKELIFTTKMLNQEYSLVDQINIKFQFQELKENAYYKALNKQKLNIIEGMLIERIIAKYNGYELISIEEHLKLIDQCCEDIPEKRNLLGFFESFLTGFRRRKEKSNK